MASKITPIRQLNNELRKVARKVTAEQTVLIQKKLTFDLLGGMIKRTPVDEGRARGGWQVGVSEPPSGLGLIEQGQVGDFSGQTFNAGISKLSGLEPFQIVYITNGVSYITVLDQGDFDPPDPGPSKDPREDRKGRILVKDGFSTQAPQGMVDVTIASLVGVFS